jgi:hypothetical protein
MFYSNLQKIPTIHISILGKTECFPYVSVFFSTKFNSRCLNMYIEYKIFNGISQK